MMMIPWQYPEGNDNGSDVDGQSGPRRFVSGGSSGWW